MRIWLHSSTKWAGLGPSGAVSFVAHVALISGAVYGTGRASLAVRQEIAERVFFLPPPDRAPSAPPAMQRVQYIAAGQGAPREAVARIGTVPAGGGGEEAHRMAERNGADEVTQSPQGATAATPDSVYSVLSVDESATRVEGSGAPVYPPALLERHVEGSVSARYVIDSTGHTEPSSLEILAATDPGFVQAVRDALPLMRFSAGTAGGHHVRQLVEQNFVFHITPPLAPAPADHTRATRTP